MRLALTAAAVLFACPAFAETPCDIAETMRGVLAVQFGERPVSVGNCIVDHARGRCTTWRNHQTQSWTLTFSPADGVECMVASGFSDERDG